MGSIWDESWSNIAVFCICSEEGGACHVATLAIPSFQKLAALKVATKSYPLWSVEETESWIRDRLTAITNYLELPQESLPECTDEDLWVRKMNEKYKYYSSLDSLRASKVFGYDKYEHPEAEAQLHLANKGTGIVKHFPAMAVRCRYCSVQSICSQAARMQSEGRLDL